MPPPSSPVPRLSSVPSAVFTVCTIASRSPPRPLVSAIRERDGRLPRPLLGDVIATTSPPHRHRLTSSQRPQGSASTFCHHARLVLFLVFFPPSGGEVGKSKRANETGRENQGEGCCRPLRPFLSSVCCPHLPRPRPFFPSVFVCGSCYSSP